MKNKTDGLAIDDAKAREYLEKLLDFNKKYKSFLLASVIIIILLSSGVYLFYHFKMVSDNKAAYALNEITALIKNDSLTGTSSKEIADKYKKLSEEYSASKAKKMADLIYASYLYDIGKYSDASKLYEESVKYFNEDYIFGRIASAGAGYSFIMLKDSSKALPLFNEITGSNKFIAKDEAYINKGLIYNDLKDEKSYQESFSDSLKANSNSIYSQLIKERFPG